MLASIYKLYVLRSRNYNRLEKILWFSRRRCYKFPFDAIATVRAEITDAGKRTGAKVLQLYVMLPPTLSPTPSRQLRGLVEIEPLCPGADERIPNNLSRKDVSFWEVVKQEFVVSAGKVLRVTFVASPPSEENGFSVCCVDINLNL